MGRYEPNTIPHRAYYVKDHLGTTRATVNEAGTIVSSDACDPWGMALDGQSVNNSDINGRYKYTGKERDIETNYDYFGARYCDAKIARWLAVDPSAGMLTEWSGYNY